MERNTMDNSTSFASTFKSGFVTIIGRPNVGKSTLMNQIIGQKIAITSNKPQTTRNRIQTVYTEKERGQIIFLDTPGIHKAKNKLGEYMVNTAEHTLQDVDVVLWLVEPSDFVGAGERHIAQMLQKAQIPVILVINKIDIFLLYSLCQCTYSKHRLCFNISRALNKSIPALQNIARHICKCIRHTLSALHCFFNISACFAFMP